MSASDRMFARRRRSRRPEPSPEAAALQVFVFENERFVGTELFGAGSAIVVGRGVDADLRLESPSVSRAHLRLWWEADEVLVRDLGSANGTFLDRRRLTGAAALSSRDSVQVGPYTLRARALHEAPPRPYDVAAAEADTRLDAVLGAAEPGGTRELPLGLGEAGPPARLLAAALGRKARREASDVAKRARDLDLLLASFGPRPASAVPWQELTSDTSTILPPGSLDAALEPWEVARCLSSPLPRAVQEGSSFLPEGGQEAEGPRPAPVAAAGVRAEQTKTEERCSVSPVRALPALRLVVPTAAFDADTQSEPRSSPPTLAKDRDHRRWSSLPRGQAGSTEAGRAPVPRPRVEARLVTPPDFSAPPVPVRFSGVEVLARAGGRLLDVAVLRESGQQYVLGHPTPQGVVAPCFAHPGLRLVRMHGPEQVDLVFPLDVQGELERLGQRVRLEALAEGRRYSCLRLEPGDRARLVLGSGSEAVEYEVAFRRQPPVGPREGRRPPPLPR